MDNDQFAEVMKLIGDETLEAIDSAMSHASIRKRKELELFWPLLKAEKEEKKEPLCLSECLAIMKSKFFSFKNVN